MKHLIYFSFLFFMACQSSTNSSGDNRKDSTEDSVITSIDSSEIITEPTPYISENLQLYSDYHLEFDDGQKFITFIPLSDGYRWHWDSEIDRDSIIIDRKYLGTINENYNYHTLSEVSRRAFLDTLQISETDSVFTFSYTSNKIERWQVADLKVVAWVSYYESSKVYNSYQFMVGFETSTVNSREDFKRGITAIDARNPFRRGAFVPISWRKSDTTLLDLDMTVMGPTRCYRIDSTGTPLEFSYQNYRLVVQDFFQKFQRQRRNELVNYFDHTMRKLVVTDTETGMLISEKYYFDTEGTSPAYVVEAGTNGDNVGNQWVGHLFWGYPPVLSDMEYQSFGCTELDILDMNGGGITLRCDNRH